MDTYKIKNGACSASETERKEEKRTDGVLNSSLEKFLKLKKRREKLSDFAQFKLSKIDERAAKSDRKGSATVVQVKKDTEKDGSPVCIAIPPTDVEMFGTKRRQRTPWQILTFVVKPRVTPFVFFSGIECTIVFKKMYSRYEVQYYAHVSPQEDWKDVRKYLDINAHLTGPIEHGILQPKSGLEEKVNDSIDKKDIDTAEQLSDQLATREFAVRINDAFAAKRYAVAEEIKKEISSRKRKKRIKWGFDAKQRWEMKGNM